MLLGQGDGSGWLWGHPEHVLRGHFWSFRSSWPLDFYVSLLYFYGTETTHSCLLFLQCWGWNLEPHEWLGKCSATELP